MRHGEVATVNVAVRSARHGLDRTGSGYFDLVAQVVSGGQASTLALAGSTEEEQFEH